MNLTDTWFPGLLVCHCAAMTSMKIQRWWSKWAENSTDSIHFCSQVQQYTFSHPGCKKLRPWIYALPHPMFFYIEGLDANQFFKHSEREEQRSFEGITKRSRLSSIFQMIGVRKQGRKLHMHSLALPGGVRTTFTWMFWCNRTSYLVGA